MTLETFFEKFNQFAKAPNFVAKMRELVLQLAVQGKLVPQDPNDEPAAELLKQIGAEKARLVKGRGIRKQEAMTPIEIEDQPFELPTKWKWVRFGNIADFSAGRTPSRHDSSYWNTGDYPWVSIADMKNGEVVFTTKETISEKAKKQIFRSEPSPIGTLIMSFKLTIGKISRLGVPAFHNEAIISIRPHLTEMDAYFFIVLPRFSQLGDTKDAIKGATLNRDSLTHIFIPLPPLTEQKRIVAKVDELMALCDRLEAQQQERETQQARCAHAAVARFATAPTPANIELLFHKSYSVSPADFRKTILTLAVQGKLVPQGVDQNIESDTRSLDEMTHQHLMIFSSLPNGWSRMPLARVAEEIVDCPHSTPQWTEQGKICVRTNQFHPGKLDLSTPRYVSNETFNKRIQRLQPQEDDILYSREGGILGVACRVPPNTELCLGQRMILIRAGNTVAPIFLELVLNSPLITEVARRETTGGAAPRVNVATIKIKNVPNSNPTPS